MQYLSDWRAISAMVQGALQISRLDPRVVEGTPNGVIWALVYSHLKLFSISVKTFRDQHKGALPQAALALIQSQEGNIIHEKDLTAQDLNNNKTTYAITSVRLAGIVAFDSELTFLLADSQQVMRSLAERAFVHLKRLIVVDEEVRAKWKAAYAQGEVRCETLGAVHLLHHGIYAFKAGAKGAATDLVFKEPATADGVSADALVLTEWKVARSANKIASEYAAAENQARLYSEGTLGGVELRKYRYLVVVVEKDAPPIPDTTQNGITYRHIIIPVDPDNASTAAKKLSRRGSTAVQR